MCLIRDQDATDQIRKRFRESKDGFITCYKILKITSDGRLKSIIYDISDWFPGVKQSNRTIFKRLFRKNEEFVNQGIHVYTDPVWAKRFEGHQGDDWKLILVPVKCYKRDFVSAGYNYVAVFNKVTLLEEHYFAAKNSV